MSTPQTPPVPGKLGPAWRRWLLIGAGLGVLGLLAGLGARELLADTHTPSVVLLVPNSQSLDQPVVQAWRDAAREEGLHLTPMTDNEFMRYGGAQGRIAGVILPDTVHQEASDLLIGQLYDYVHGGGRLLLSFDAAIHGPGQKVFARDISRLSRLAGVNYAMYRELRDDTYADDRVLGSVAAARQLGLQPGKLDFKHSVLPPLGELTTYGYPRLHYAHFRTQPAAEVAAQVLLQSPVGDVIVSQHRFGQGEVLFANLALGYLKTRTDGHLLHRLLNHFVVGMLQQPRLAAVPEGVGGMVLNLHIDSNAAEQPLLQLEQEGWFQRGPYSLHLTAGPDTYNVGDRMGLNLDHNPAMQGFLRRQLALGHEVGNHGGWGHNIFGLLAHDANGSTYQPMLQLNHDSVSRVIGRPARSYSAPMGNHPVWAHHWLADNHFRGYYFTGDTGLGPTRSYVDGRPPASRVWAFPVSNLNQIATFEELEQPQRGRSSADMVAFLEQLPRHVAATRVARLFYFHPPAAEEYRDVLERLDQQTQALAAQHRFRWYTMERLADFMDQREQVLWQVQTSGTLTQPAQRERKLVASSSTSLKDISWVFPLASASAFEVEQGSAEVRREATEWVLTATSGQMLVVKIRGGVER